MTQAAETSRLFVPVAIRAVFARVAPCLDAVAGRSLSPADACGP